MQVLRNRNRPNSSNPAPQAARKKATAEAAKRIDALIAEIRRAQILKKVRFSIGLPKMPLPLDLVNSRAFKFALRVQNRSDEELILWPYLRIEVLDAQGNTIKTSVLKEA